MQPRKNLFQKGSTLVEAIVAASVLCLALAGICATNWKSINVLRMNKQEAAVTFCLEERMEQLRNAPWASVTSSGTIQSFMNTQPADAGNVPGFTEEVTINSFPTAASTPIDVTESGSNSASVNTDNTTFASGGQGSMIKVDVTVTWPNYYGPTHQRTITTIISNGGI